MPSEGVYETHNEKVQPDATESQIGKIGEQEASTELSSADGSLSDDNNIPILSEKEIRYARRKTDYRLLLWYSFVYLIMRIDVSNISNTAIMNKEQGTGIKKQLGNLSSEQWAWALSIF